MGSLADCAVCQFSASSLGGEKDSTLVFFCFDKKNYIDLYMYIYTPP